MTESLLENPAFLYRFLENRAAVVALCAFALAGALLFYLSAVTNNDVAILMAEAESFLDGGALYGDIQELNPPLIIYLNAPPILLGRLLGLSSQSAFVVFVIALIGLSLSLVWSASDCGSSGRDARPARLLALGVLVLLTFFPMFDFGEREHLLMIFCMPYLFLTARRARSLPFNPFAACLVGLLAGLGFAMKPHFLLAPLLLEIYLILHLRKVRVFPERLAAAFVILAYAVSIPLFTPLYLQRTVPYLLLSYDRGYGKGLFEVVGCWETVALALLVGFRLATRTGERRRIELDVMLIAAFALWAAYVAQMKTFDYHLAPVCIALALALLVIAMDGALRRARQGLVSGLAIIALGAIALQSFEKGRFRDPVMEPMLQAMKTYAGGSDIGVFSSYNWIVYPMALMAGSRIESSALWVLPGVERQLTAGDLDPNSERFKKLKEAERFARDTLVEGFERARPALVIVDEKDRRFEGLSFDYLDFFGRDARFRELWQGYRRIGAVCVGEDIGPYGLYVKGDPPPPPSPLAEGLHIHAAGARPHPAGEDPSAAPGPCARERY